MDLDPNFGSNPSPAYASQAPDNVQTQREPAPLSSAAEFQGDLLYGRSLVQRCFADTVFLQVEGKTLCQQKDYDLPKALMVVSISEQCALLFFSDMLMHT